MQETEEIKSISIIGVGNVGWHLSQALHEAGYEIKHIVSRSQEKLESLVQKLCTIHLTSIDQVQEEPDLYLICVQDVYIPEISASLSSSQSIVVHTSGGSDLKVFSAKQDKYGVFYPLQTFTKGNNMDWSEIPFLLEADNQSTLNKLKVVANRISGKYNFADSSARLKVHIAAVFACNFSNHMATIADSLLKKEGLDFKIVYPLLKETIKKLDRMSPDEAQTGPAIRNDAVTMERHMELLKEFPEWQEIYRLISKSIPFNPEP